MKGLRSPSSVEARERFLAALARGESVASAARFAGIARQVPYVWASRNDDVVRDALAAARRARGSGGARPPVPPAAAGEPAGDAPAVGPDEAAELLAMRRAALAALAAYLAPDATCAPSTKVAAAKAILAAVPPTRERGAAPAAGAAEADDDPAAALRVLRGRARALLAEGGA